MKRNFPAVMFNVSITVVGVNYTACRVTGLRRGGLGLGSPEESQVGLVIKRRVVPSTGLTMAVIAARRSIRSMSSTIEQKLRRR